MRVTHGAAAAHTCPPGAQRTWPQTQTQTRQQQQQQQQRARGGSSGAAAQEVTAAAAAGGGAPSTGAAAARGGGMRRTPLVVRAAVVVAGVCFVVFTVTVFTYTTSFYTQSHTLRSWQEHIGLKDPRDQAQAAEQEVTVAGATTSVQPVNACQQSIYRPSVVPPGYVLGGYGALQVRGRGAPGGGGGGG